MTAVLPWTDRDASALARHHARFERAGVALVCPPGPLVALAGDKWATTDRLALLGVPVPETREVSTGGQLREAAEQLGYPGRTLILKPRHLAGGAGVWRVAADADPMRPGARPSLPLAALAAALDNQDGARELVLQHEVHGVDTSVDVLAHEGRLLAAVARTRAATLGGLSVAGQVSAPTPAVHAVVERIVVELNWSSLANIQLITTPDGRPVVYEVNARASGSIGLAAYAGVDLLTSAIHLARTGSAGTGPGPAGALNPQRPSGGITAMSFRRYWLDHSWPTVHPPRPDLLADPDAAHAEAAEDANPGQTTWPDGVHYAPARQNRTGCAE